MDKIAGIVTDIQRFSLHDGPGIRTNVFLKGCNMRCAWCHNPETLSFEPEYIVDPDKCIHCGKCAEGCYSGARRLVGREMTPEEVMHEVLLDRDYYGADGGMTLTGGEPTCQSRFAKALFALANENGIGCAIETNLTAPQDIYAGLLPMCRMMMCDMKIWDSELHRKWTGVDNTRIRENLRFADTIGIPIIVRTPVIAGINDTEDEIGSIADFLCGIRNLQYYELLPYHALGLSKALEGKQKQENFRKPDNEALRRLALLARDRGLSVCIAGKAVTGG